MFPNSADMRNVCYITGTRADFGLMEAVLRAISSDSHLSLSLLVTGMHLSPQFGETVNEVRQTGLFIAGTVPVPLEPATGATMAKNIGRMVGEFTNLLEKIRPHILLLLGDRGEMLAGAIAAIHLNIPVAHVHGGERSGTVDEPVRHAISKLSHVHFTSTDESRQRLIRMGELEANVHFSGAPGLDGICDVKLVSKNELLAKYGLVPDRPFVLLVYHPVLQEADQSEQQMLEILSALLECDHQILALMPNSDAGSAGVRRALASVQRKEGVSIATHLSRPEFLSAMACAAALVGNSSSAIIEAASFGIPVVNIGSRQNLRERNCNTLDADNNIDAIREAIYVALRLPRFEIRNVYGDGNAATRIVAVLREMSITASLLKKVNSY